MHPEAAKPWDWTEDDDATLRLMWAADATVREVADAIGCTEHQVNRRRKHLSLPPRPDGWKPATAPKMAPYYVAPAPRCRDADASFARAMAGRRFESVSMKPSTAPARVYSVSRTEHRGASSLEINA